MIADEVLPDRHRIAATVERLRDQLPERLAGPGARLGERGDSARAESVDTALRNNRRRSTTTSEETE